VKREHIANANAIGFPTLREQVSFMKAKGFEFGYKDNRSRVFFHIFG
jgi:hypothetical protein